VFSEALLAIFYKRKPEDFLPSLRNSESFRNVTKTSRSAHKKAVPENSGTALLFTLKRYRFQAKN
jgi:hypothetical protein